MMKYIKGRWMEAGNAPHSPLPETILFTGREVFAMLMSKRFFALLLALLLLLSMGIPVGAAELSFSDRGSIRHTTAVATLAEAGIITGYPDGSFGPERTLTRAEASAILTRMLRGSTQSRAAFTDVPGDFWAAGYIAYCSNNNLVSGYAGRFYPKDALTGSAWSKMVLAALGYDAEETGMTGNDWEAGVSALASAQELYRGLDSFDPTMPVSRQDACQIAFNCMYHGEEPEQTDPSGLLNKLSYPFGNNARVYSYPTPYQIPYERFRLIYGDTEKAREMQNRFKTWGGSCYGMSATSGLFYQPGNGVSVSAFNSRADTAWDLSVDDRSDVWRLSVKEFIEAMHITQLDDNTNIEKARNRDDLDALASAVEGFQRSGRDPVIVLVWGTHNGQTGGHAIVGYGLENVSSTESRLKVYDVNYPRGDRFITLRKSGGSYTGWSYEIFDGEFWGDTDPNGQISFVNYNIYFQSWQNRKGDLLEENMLFLSVNEDARIMDGSGGVAAEVRDGKVIPFQSNVYPMEAIGLSPDGIFAPPIEGTVWLPGNRYTVQRLDDGDGALEVTFTQVNQSVSVSTTAGNMMLNVDDSTSTRLVSFPSSEAGSDYQITIRSSYGDERDESAEITSAGTVPDTGSTMGSEQGAVVNDGGETIYVDGEPYTGGKNVEDYPIILDSFNTYAVRNGSTLTVNGQPLRVMSFSFDSRICHVQAITTYHWNYGQGQTPGTISLYQYDSRSDSRLNVNGRLVGQWQASGRSGSGAGNVLWDVFPDVYIYPGYYAIVDSDPDTWSSNDESDGMYFTQLRGVYVDETDGVG